MRNVWKSGFLNCDNVGFSLLAVLNSCGNFMLEYFRIPILKPCLNISIRRNFGIDSNSHSILNNRKKLGGDLNNYID